MYYLDIYVIVKTSGDFDIYLCYYYVNMKTPPYQ